MQMDVTAIFPNAAAMRANQTMLAVRANLVTSLGNVFEITKDQGIELAEKVEKGTFHGSVSLAPALPGTTVKVRNEKVRRAEVRPTIYILEPGASLPDLSPEDPTDDLSDDSDE